MAAGRSFPGCPGSSHGGFIGGSFALLCRFFPAQPEGVHPQRITIQQGKRAGELVRE